VSCNEIRPCASDIVITLDKHAVSQVMKPASIRPNAVQRAYLYGKYHRSYSGTPRGLDSGQIPSGNKFSNCVHSMPADMLAARKLCVCPCACACVKIADLFTGQLLHIELGCPLFMADCLATTV